MKETLKKSSLMEQWFFTQSPLIITRPALRETAACLGLLLGGFLLACGSLGGQCAPFALGLIVAAGGGLRGLAAVLGASVGFLTMQPFSQGLELTSAAILTFVTMYIFGSLWVTKRPWFCCLVPGVMRAAVGAIFLFSRSLTPALLLEAGLSVLLAAASPLAFLPLLQGRHKSLGTLLGLSCFVVGGAAISLPWGIQLGLMLAVALLSAATRRADYGTAATMGAGAGLALDWAGGTGGRFTLCLTLGALAGGGIHRRHPLLRLLAFTLAAGVGLLSLGSPTLGELLSLLGGILLSFLVPPGLVAGREESAIAQSCALVEERLSFGSTALRALYEAIGIDPREALDQERQQIFDKAASKVCRRCTRYAACWEKHSQETYQQLRSALGPILERGEALREDFPEHFSQECRHMEGLLVALNQELGGIAYRSQCRSRNEESRVIASQALRHVSSLLEANARQLRSVQRLPQEAYTARVGLSAVGRRGARVSGDKGICLHTEDGRFFTILCDGSGTGPEAAQESLLAVDSLAALIQAGLAPNEAMEFLNSMYILRDSGGFSTMDVLELSLLSGQGTLYKWGAAPSYVKSGTVVKKVGTAAPPPGLGVGNTYSAEVIRLSLWGGDMLVLVSDGVVQAETEAVIRSYDGENVKELASLLLQQAQASGGEDDMTVAVLRLEELRS